MSDISNETVKEIANLANLEFTSNEMEKLVDQLKKIVEYVETLNLLNTSNVAETAYAIDIYNIWREDKKSPSIEPDMVLSQAPDEHENCFRVPRIID